MLVLVLSTRVVYDRHLSMRSLLLVLVSWCCVSAVHGSFPAPDFAKYPGKIPLRDKSREELRAQIVSLRKLTRDQPDYYDGWIAIGGCLDSDSKPDEAAEAFRKAIALRPDDPAGSNNLGVILLRQRSYADALPLFRKVVEVDAKQPYGWNNLALALWGMDQLDEAEAAARKALAIDPKHALAWSALGYIETKRKGTDAAVKAFDRALAVDKGSVSANVGIVWALSEAGRRKEARERASEAVQAAPKSAMLHAALGILCLQDSAFTEAAREGQIAVDLDPNSAFGWMALGGARIRLKKWDTGIPAVEKARALGAGNAAILGMLLEAYDAARQPGKATEAVEQALAQNPKDPLILLCVADFRLKHGSFDDSAELFLKVIRAGTHVKLAWVGITGVFLAQGKTGEAIEAGKKAVETDPLLLPGWVNLAVAYAEKNYRQAAGAASKALELAPGSWQAWTVLALAEQDPDKALAAGRKAVEFGGDKGWSHHALGRAFLRNRRSVEALEELRKAATLSPRISEYHYWIAMAYREASRLTEAVEAAKRAIEVDPSALGNWNLLGDIQLHAHQYDEAVAAFTHAICLNPNNALAHLGLGRVRMKTAIAEGAEVIPDSAVREFERAAIADPGLRLTWDTLLNCYSKLGRRNEAADAARTVIRLQGKASRELAGEGISRVTELIAESNATREPGATIRLLLEAQGLVPSDMIVLSQVVTRLIAVGAKNEALELAFRTVEQFGDRAAAHAILAQALVAAKRPEEGMAAYTRAADVDPGNAAYWEALGWTALSIQRGDEAATAFTKAAKLYPEQGNNFVGLFRALMLQRDPIGAERLFKQFTQEFPETAPAWFALGSVEITAGMRTAGMQHLLHAVKLQPEYGMAWMSIGDEVMKQAGGRERAVVAYERSLKARPGEPMTLTSLGHAQLLLGRPELAIRAFNEALKVSPESTSALPDLIRALWQVGAHEEAQQRFEQLRKAEPKVADAVQAELNM